MKRGKGELGKTKKYSSLASTVKQSSPKEIQEPLPRLSLDRIKRIYDEYGFAEPDGGKVQATMPNDEQKLRKTLELHRKVLDEEIKSRADKKMSDMKYHTDIYKQNQKNHLDTMKAAAKAAKQGGAQMPQMNGMGGPGMPQQMPQMQAPQPAQPMQQSDNVGGGEMLPPGMAPNQQPLDISNAGEAFFVGEFALVKLVNPGVQSDKSPIWLVDVKNKVLRPFMSQKAFDTYFGASQEAYDAVVVLPSSAVSEGGPLGEFKMMNSEFGVKEDGSMRKLDHSPAMIQRRYGKPVDEASENRSVLALDGLFKKIKSGGSAQPGMHQMPDGSMMSDTEMPQGGTGGPGYDGVGGPGLPTLNVSRSLEPGMTGEDVKSLQDWLKAQGYLNIANTTTYYGDKTKAAVAAWQKANGIDAGQYPGYFGPRSLTKAQSLSPSTPTQSTPTTPTTNTDFSKALSIGLANGTIKTQDDVTQLKQNYPTPSTPAAPPAPPVDYSAQNAANAKLKSDRESAWNAAVEASKTNGGKIPSDWATIYAPGASSVLTEGTTTQSPSTGLPYNRVTQDGLPVSGQGAWSQLNAGLSTAGATTTISSSMIEKVKQDPSLLAFYINALTYGGYTLGEVFKDIKRRELISTGKKEYEDKLVISGEKTREEWAQTDEGRLANTLPEFAAMKPGLNNIDPSIFNLPLFDIPSDAFKQLIPILDPTTPEFKAEIEKIQSVMHDIQVATINAKTEQEKAAADYEYEKFKETINKTYGVALSNNAGEAWKQIESLGTSMSQAGIKGSGIENEAVDSLLRDTRKKDEGQREDKLTKEEAGQAKQLARYGTPEEIKKLVDEDKAKGLPREQWRATKWGLVPSEEALKAFDLNALKQKYPDKTDKELQRLRDGVIDQYGNYRTDLYQRKWNSLETERVTDTSAKTTEYLEKQKLAEKKAYQEFTAADNPYSRPKVAGAVVNVSKPVIPSMTTIQENKATPVTYGPNDQLPANVSKPLEDAIAGIKKSISGLQSPQTSVPTTPTFGDTRTSSTPKTQYNTLYDYYSKNGGYNTWNSTKRMADAKAAGITNYTGTEDQNKALLKSLRGY